MQQSHETIRQIAREHTETAINQNISDHDRKAFPRVFKVGDMILLEVKNFLNKNHKKYNNSLPNVTIALS